MTEIQSRIMSIKDSVGGVYEKPNREKFEQFYKDLFETPHALDYLKITRNLSDETIKYFKLGYDKARDAIAIPVFKRGELINIRYRFINPGDKPKYSQEKGCEVWVYHEDGIDRGKELGGVLIVEGEFDLMSCWQAGFKNVISPASGKDSYGIWLELLESIPKVYVCYDNDKPGKQASKELAERLGNDKCYEVNYPEGIKDANEYFSKFTHVEYRQLIRQARPFYKYKFAGVVDVITNLREKIENVLRINCIPFVEFEEDHIAVLSADSNVGKTSFSLNIINELANKGIPTLMFPIERGINDCVKRFLQVRYGKNKHDIRLINDEEWDKKIIPDVLNLPVYFSMPSVDELEETIKKAKRYFNINLVIIDHLDLLVRNTDPKNLNQDTARTVQEIKRLAQEYRVIFIMVHHIKKPENSGGAQRKPRKEDLKGTATLYQDPEVVIMLSAPEKDLSLLEVDIVKNKGTMGSKVYNFNVATGVVGAEAEKPMTIDDF